jgi:methyl-accepting chemotaxis protein
MGPLTHTPEVNAAQGNSVVLAASTEAVKGGNVFAQVVATMQDISES